MRYLSVCLCLAFFIPTWSQKEGREITFPDIPGYRTLKCDFHIHTVFSDGSVWPNIRVQEAVADGLDAISLTEHIEYQPHQADIPHPDRNRSYEIAKQQARAYDLLIIHGAEITRDMPPGHANAIFIQDANKLLLKDSIAAYREAKAQGAFIFWNHPNWISQRKDGISTLTDLHRMLIKEELLDGIEVVNDLTYSEEALQIALDQDITVIGTSDIHGLVDWKYEIANGGHRPVMLVLATEKSESAIKEAMEDGRTIAWFKNLLIGKQAALNPLVKECIQVKRATYQGPSSVVSVTLENRSDANFILHNHGAYTFHADGDILLLPAHSELVVEVKTVEQMEQFELVFEVQNAISGPDEHPILSWLVEVDTDEIKKG